MIFLWLAAAASIGSATGAVRDGWWEVRTLTSGADRPVVRRLCLRNGRWLMTAVPAAIRQGCATVGSSLPIDGACPGQGRLRVDGIVGASAFSIVARRTGAVGINPRAAVSVVSEGRRLTDHCP